MLETVDTVKLYNTLNGGDSELRHVRGKVDGVLNAKCSMVSTPGASDCFLVGTITGCFSSREGSLTQ